MDGAGENAGNDGENGGAVKEDEEDKQWTDVDLKEEGDAIQHEGSASEIPLNDEISGDAEGLELHTAGVNVAAAEAGSDAPAAGQGPEVEVQSVMEQDEQGCKAGSSGARIHGMQTRAMASASHAGNSNPLPPLSGSAGKRSREEEETDEMITAVFPPVEETSPESGGFPKKKLWDQLRSMRISTPHSTRAKSRVSKVHSARKAGASGDQSEVPGRADGVMRGADDTHEAAADACDGRGDAAAGSAAEAADASGKPAGAANASVIVAAFIVGAAEATAAASEAVTFTSAAPRPAEAPSAAAPAAPAAATTRRATDPTSTRASLRRTSARLKARGGAPPSGAARPSLMAATAASAARSAATSGSKARPRENKRQKVDRTPQQWKAPTSSRPTGLTVPQPFNLRTDVRIRPGDVKLKNEAQPFVSLAQSVQAFARSSRSSDAEAGAAHGSRPGVSAVPAAAEPHLTVPQPFVFNTEKRRGSQNEKTKEAKPFVSLAQSVSMFGIRGNRSSEVESGSHDGGSTHELGLTIPEPFDFKTNRRQRPKDEQLKKEAKPFVSLAQSVSMFGARSDHRSSETEHKAHESGPSHGATLTVPEPFDFKTDRRLRPKDEQLKKEAKPFVSLAESVSMFGARSSRSSETESHAHEGGPSNGATLTIPEPFDLKTDRRQRPKDERLKKEAKPFVSLAQELSSFSAHMRPEGEAPTAASAAASDAPRVTKPVTPKLLTAQRERPRRFRVLQEGEAAGTGVMTRSASKRGATATAAGGAGGGAGGVAGPRLPTVPCSPMLTTKLRARAAKVKSSEERELEEMASAAKRMHTSKHGSSEVPTVTHPREFHLFTEERGQAKQHKLQQKLAEEEEERRRAAIPLAAPMPFTTLAPEFLRKPPTKPATEPEEFELESVRRHQMAQQRLEEEAQRKAQEEAAQKEFHAQPLPDMTKRPESPRRIRVLTEVKPFNLNVDRQAEHHTCAKKAFAERCQQGEEEYAKMQARCRKEEEEEIKRMRKGMVHHAVPKPSYGEPFVPKRSGKPLTQPVSPCPGLEAVRASRLQQEDMY
ncbi:unnamed protein product [Closterium sp. NIES-64]|nr:unnamed protein product [Closterium sp. NIES-64]